MEDSQLATGFGGQVGNVTFPGKIMADRETQKLERKQSRADQVFFFPDLEEETS